MTAAAPRALDLRRRAFAEALGRLVAELVWREITAPGSQNAAGRPSDSWAARGEAQGHEHDADYDQAS